MFSLTLRSTLWLVLASAAAAPAATLIDDGFELATHPTGSRTVTAGLGAVVYSRYLPGTTSAILQADATFGSTALVVTDQVNADGFNSPIIFALPFAVTLGAINDNLEVSVSFHFTGSAASTNDVAQFRLGFSNSNGTPVTADGQTESTNDFGYYAQVGESTTPAGNNVFWRETGSINPILAGNDRANLLIVPTGFSVSNDLSHTAVFSLTRTAATTVQLSLSIDGATALTVAHTGSPHFTFDELAFSNGFTPTGLTYALDNVVVTSTVPEPGAAGLLASGVALLGWRRRSARKP